MGVVGVDDICLVFKLGVNQRTTCVVWYTTLKLLDAAESEPATSRLTACVAIYRTADCCHSRLTAVVEFCRCTLTRVYTYMYGMPFHV